MRVALKESRLALRNSTTRLPFRYGSACMTACPQAVLGVAVEADGRAARGASGDCLPPGWFDKSGKDYVQQIDDMLLVIRLAEQAFGGELAAPGDFFAAWLAAGERVHRQATERGLPSLLASFGVSMLERAIMDAMARAARLSFFQAVRENLYGIVPGEVHRELDGLQPSQWLPSEPRTSVYVRHTVGLIDPLTAGEIPPAERLDDGLPQALEQYIQRDGTRYFKIKVSNRLDHDLERLEAIAAIIEGHRGSDYSVTLDGNEQYAQADQFDALIDALEGRPKLATLLANTLAVEQPLDRKIALDAAHTDGVRRLCRQKPVIIDESDGTLDAYPRALELGYRGTSSKSCKGPIKSLLNAGLTWLRNERGRRDEFIMTGEDLCCVGIVPVQSDLCLVAALGLAHVERNGHHYHRGLSYLPETQRAAALAAHGDLYVSDAGLVRPRVVDGMFQIGSLQCEGFGFAVEPDLDAMQPVDQWDYASLGF